MPVGQQPTRASIDGVLTSLALQKREIANDIIQEWAYLNKIGTAGLQALGYTAPEATQVLDDINHMVTPEQVYKGTVQAQGTGGTGAILFNFEDFLTHLWAGQ